MSYPASEKQVGFIGRLLAEKEVPASTRTYVEGLLADGITKQRASDAISHLLSLPKAAVPTLDVDVQARERVSEEGFYQSEDGDVFKVVRTKDGERLYAKKTSASGLVYVPGAMGKIFADQKLTGEQLAALGITFGYCIVCSTEFEDPTSKHIGIGPVCGKRELGADAYKALRLTVADRPDVIAFEAAKKERAKAAREAKKREEAQLVLV